MLQTLKNSLANAHGVRVDIYQVDVRDKHQIQSKVEEYPIIDIVINNAGLAMGMDSVVNTKDEALEVMLDTNVKGLMYVTRAVLPKMLERGEVCTIINIGSIAGKQAYPNGSVYCASKHAVHAFSQSLRMELTSTKIRVCEINPGTDA
jgi:3-hydroxy acid dehydrogenase/malonic semialdehyde reductase